MKKFIILFIALLTVLPAKADNTDCCFTNKPLITDELTEHESFIQNINEEKIVRTPIADELLEPRKNNSNNLFMLNAYKSDPIIKTPISDELISPEFIAKAISQKINTASIFNDDFLEKKLDISKVKKVTAKNKYDFTKKIIPVNIRLAEKYSHKDGKVEGDILKFLAEHDFEINGKKFFKGTPIYGRIETISQADKMGTPESIKIDNFYIDNKPEINLNGSISKTGANRSIWVYPLYQAGNICLYVAGFIFVPIHGGHAKLTANETYTVFYETQ